MKAYKELETVFHRHAALCGAGSILQWDNAAMMPEGAGEPRGEQLAVIAELSHGMMTDPRLAEWFAHAEADKAGLDDWQQANLHEMKRSWLHDTAVPADLVLALTKACHASELFWRQARRDNDFKAFLPYQEKVLALVRESAQAKAAVLGLDPYDALLDQYDPGTRTAEIDVIFDDLAAFLPGFLARVTEYQNAQTPPLPLRGHFPASAQKALGMRMMKKLGFDFAHGRLDESTHPFCGGVPGDIRLTTRYDEEDFLSGFFGVLHETGHALYEMGLPEAWRYQPVGQARGMAFHESQSLLNEMQLSLSLDFLRYASPLICEAFGVAGGEWSPENLSRLLTRVQPSLIRVDADEATYPAHIILRYRLEKRMIAGSLAIADLPEAWSQGMRELLGIVPDSDRNGCLQDIHWPDGAFGYFPSYTLGAMTAAQLFAAARVATPGLADMIAKGEFQPLYAWLREHVHSQGSKFTARELLVRATGKALDPAIYKAHLEKRYLS